MKLISLEDFRDIYIKLYQRGFSFLSSKFSLDKNQRTKSAFNTNMLQSSNWWIIPAVRKRWNFLITGNENKTYEELITDYFKNAGKKKMISLGSGVCSHEIRLAELNPNWEIHCYDFADELLKKAKEISDEKGLQNIFFHAENVLKTQIPKETYDIVFFHQSLHHFDDIKNFIREFVKKILKKEGHLIINEFVGKNRLQFDKTQIQHINKAIKMIPKKLRKIFKTNLHKNKFYGNGFLRMYIADPSECVDSESILPVIHENFETIIERPFGGNLLMSALKDISHHFVEREREREEILKKVFEIEDVYLKKNDSDFVFGVYYLNGK